jgi:hypothetical protein
MITGTKIRMVARFEIVIPAINTAVHCGITVTV